MQQSAFGEVKHGALEAEQAVDTGKRHGAWARLRRQPVTMTGWTSPLLADRWMLLDLRTGADSEKFPCGRRARRPPARRAPAGPGGPIDQRAA